MLEGDDDMKCEMFDSCVDQMRNERLMEIISTIGVGETDSACVYKFSSIWNLSSLCCSYNM